MWFWSSPKIDPRAAEGHIRAAIAGLPITLETLRVTDRDIVAILQVVGATSPALNDLAQTLETDLQKNFRAKSVRVILTAHQDVPPSATVHGHLPKKPPTQIEGLAAGVKHIIAVASGKGGVGKSTVATNLAVALAMTGVKAGLLDADIYGPSLPMMMGLTGVRAENGADGKLQPIVAHQVACMSMGLLTDPATPMIWRGPMVQTAIVQMLRDVDWSGVEVLVIDLPPGTGDAQLTMAQKIKLSGAIIVSTPQDVALIDARKGLEMFKKTNVPILGLVQNMAMYCCPNCGHESAVFGDGGAARVADELGVPLLASIPLDPRICQQGDAGVPIVTVPDAGKISAAYQNLARDVRTILASLSSPDLSHSRLSQE